MRYVPALLCALAVGVAQILYGGAMRSVFALPSYFLIGLAGVLGLLTLRRKSVSRAHAGCVLSVLAFAGWLLWREFTSPDPWLAASYLRLTLACVTMYLLFVVVITNPLHRLVFLSLVLVFALVQAGLGAWQFAHRHDGFPFPWFSEQLRLSYTTRMSGRAHGLYLNANHFAWFLNIATIFALALTSWGRWGAKTKVVACYVAAVTLVVSALTLSRGGILGLGAGLATFFVLSLAGLVLGGGDRRLFSLLLLIAGAAAGAMIWLYYNNHMFQGRMGELLGDSYRPAVFEAALRQFQIDPLMGTGAGTFIFYGRKFREFFGFFDDIYAHNDWMQLASDFGFVAFALLLLVVILHVGKGLGDWGRLLRRSVHLHSGLQSHGAAICLGALSCLAAFVVHSFFDFNMQIPVNALLAAACLGMIANVGVEDVESRTSVPQRVVWAVCAAFFGGWLLWASGQAARPEFYWLKAENALLASEWKQSAGYARKGLEYQPLHPRLRRTLGEALMLQGKYASSFNERWIFLQQASAEFDRVLELAPMDWTNYRLAGEALLLNRRFQKASQIAVENIGLNPGISGNYYLYASILEADGRFDEAYWMYFLSGNFPAAGPWIESRERLEARMRREIKARQRGEIP